MNTNNAFDDVNALASDLSAFDNQNLDLFPNMISEDQCDTSPDAVFDNEPYTSGVSELYSIKNEVVSVGNDSYYQASEPDTILVKMCDMFYGEDSNDLKDENVHSGLLVRIRDKPAHESDGTRAIHTLPDGLMVIGGDCGVFTTKLLPNKVSFGPFQGETVHDLAHPGFSVNVYMNGELLHHIDGWDELKANWMRFVRCTTEIKHQNMEVFQEDGEIYYKSVRDIPANTELILLLNSHLNYSSRVHDGTKNEHDTNKSVIHHRQFDNASSNLAVANESSPSLDSSLITNDLDAVDEICPRKITAVWPWSYTSHGRMSVRKAFSCATCDKIFESKYKLNRHEMTHSGVKPFKCSVCGRGFTQPSHMTSHMRTHTGEKPFKCTECDKSFSDKRMLQRHTHKHTCQQEYPCATCPKQLPMSRTLANDVQLHQKEHPGNTCDYEQTRVCNETHNACEIKDEANTSAESYASVDATANRQTINLGETVDLTLINHKVGKRGRKRRHDRNATFPCEACDKIFKTMDRLKRHMLTHSGMKPFTCPICGRGFTQSHHMTSHIRTHTGEKPYKCTECDKCFTEKNLLKRHVRIHTGERPYSCKICAKHFAVSSAVVVHMRMHREQRDYICSYCGKAFREACKLKRHTLLHTGERPYRCDICWTSFTQSAHLKSHELTHTGEKPHVCLMCGKRFRESGTLSKHCKTRLCKKRGTLNKL